MKVRTGFVSNSSSTCFLINMSNRDKSVMHRDYQVIETEYDFSGDDKRILELKRNGYRFVKNETYFDFKNKKCQTSVYQKVSKIGKPWNGRSTAMAYGQDLVIYIEKLQECNTNDYVARNIISFIDECGLDNVLFLRESAEGSGGYLPEELRNLSFVADFEFEYH